MNSYNIVPVILCGGSGTRLWPLSRESFPKQFLSIDPKENKTLLQKTLLRIKKLNKLKGPILICNEEHRFIVAEQLRELNIKNHSIILEPFGKNTAPAVALAALKSLDDGEDNILLIMSSDHEIKNEEKFMSVINAGLEYANDNLLVTFGVIPTSPNIGYGYIKSTKPLNCNEIIGEKIEEFLEKPNLDKAKEFIKDKSFSWNSGIFMFKAKTTIEEIQKYSPEVIKYCKKSLSESNYDLDFQRLDKKYFSKCPSIPIDISVMEKTSKGIVLPLNGEWSDVGNWEAAWDIAQKDENCNFVYGKVIYEKTKNCYLRSEGRLIAAIGLSDLIIVETNDAILVSKKKDSQKVKKIVEELKDKKMPEGQYHEKVLRPWGHYLSLNKGDTWQVKIIVVNKDEKLSLQMHHHRSEHWIIVSGTAKVEIDGEVKTLTENQSVYVPLGSKHRLSNPGKIPLKLIEIQSGTYIGEDDIVRFIDEYGRAKKSI